MSPSFGPTGSQAGFSLIEILVVILIISILAAIAIPMVLRQRDKGYVAQVRSALRGAASAAEAAALATDGDYSSLDQNVAALYDQGFKLTSRVAIGISADSTSFCVAAVHESLSSDNEWKTAGYDSSLGAAAPGATVCPAAAVLAGRQEPVVAADPEDGSGSGDPAGAETSQDSDGPTETNSEPPQSGTSPEGGTTDGESSDGTSTGTNETGAETSKGGGSSKPKKPK